MAEPKGTQTWTVDASAMGGKGMFWRTHCGNDKMLTRPSDGKPGFVANGERFRGVEEYRGWVVNVATQLWLPIRDAPAAGAKPIDDEAHRRGFAPEGRGKFARDGNMQAIPYLHAEDCSCGGAYCPKPKEDAPVEAAVRRRKPLEYVRPPPPPCVPVARRQRSRCVPEALHAALRRFSKGRSPNCETAPAQACGSAPAQGGEPVVAVRSGAAGAAAVRHLLSAVLGGEAASA